MSTTLIAIAEAARMLGVSTFTIRRLANVRAIRTVNVAARRLVPLSEIERVVATGVGSPREKKRYEDNKVMTNPRKSEYDNARRRLGRGRHE